MNGIIAEFKDWYSNYKTTASEDDELIDVVYSFTYDYVETKTNKVFARVAAMIATILYGILLLIFVHTLLLVAVIGWSALRI